MVAYSFDPQTLGRQRLEALCVSLQPVWSIYQALEQPRLHRDTLRLNKIMVTLTAGCRGLDCPVWGATVHFTVLGSRGKQWGRNWGFKFDALGCPCPLCANHHLHKHICCASLIQNAWDQSVPDLCISWVWECCVDVTGWAFLSTQTEMLLKVKVVFRCWTSSSGSMRYHPTPLLAL